MDKIENITKNKRTGRLIFSYLWFLICAVVPFYGFYILLKNYSASSGEVHKSEIIHTSLIIVLSLLSIYAARIFYRMYSKSKDVRIFVISVAFFTFGYIYLFHGIADPLESFFGENLFKITESYSVLLGSLVFFSFIFPLVNYSESIYKNRKNIFGLVFFFLSFFIILSVFFDQFAETLIFIKNYILFFAIGALLVTIFFSILKYSQTRSKFLFYLISGMIFALNMEITDPFPHESWALSWWYVHLLAALAFIFFSISVMRANVQEKEGAHLFSDVPIYSKLSFRMFGIIIFLSSLPLAMLSYFLLSITPENLRSNLDNNMFYALSDKESGIRQTIEKFRGNVLSMASDSFISSSLENLDPKDTKSLNTLRDYMSGVKSDFGSELLGVEIVGDNGVILNIGGISYLDRVQEEGMMHEESLGDTAISHIIVRNGLDHLDVLAISTPILHYNNAADKNEWLIGYFIEDYLKEPFTFKSFYDLPSGAPITFAVFDKQGTVIHSLPEDFKNGVHNAVYESMKRQDICDITGSIHTKDIVTPFGVNMFASYVCMANPDWTIAALTPTSFLKDQLSELRIYYIINILAFSLFMIAIVAFFSFRTVRSLENLSEASEEIAEGNLRKRANILSNDEMGALAKNFNRMTDNLISANEYIESLIRVMPVAFITTNKNGKILEANDEALKMLSYSQKDLEKKNILDLFSYRIINTSMSLLENLKLDKVLKTGFLDNISSVFIDKKGLEVPVLLSVSVIKDENGGISSIMFVAKDMTELTKDIKTRVSEFISVASHQLRTPATILKLNVELMNKEKTGKLNEKQAGYMDNIKKSTMRMIQLIDDLLRTYKIESKNMDLNFEDVDPNTILNTVLKDFDDMLKAKNCRVIIKSKGKNLSVRADATALRHVLSNIISNAIKYSSGEKSDIIIGTETCDREGKKCVKISVKDNGIGIPKDDQGRIFERFFRAANASKLDPEGTGLGLSIVKMLLDLMGGDVWFESKEGEGSTFFITLPIK